MTNKEKIAKIIYGYVSGIYCNNCRNNGNEEVCQWCVRSAMEWEISKKFSEEIADAIVETFKVNGKCCGNCVHHNNQTHYCDVRVLSLETDNDMWCTDWE